MQFRKSLNFLIFSLLISLFSSVAHALDLYEQPNNKSKVIATISKGQPLIPIYFQNDWVKVADPSNGNVGWVNRKTLSDEGYPTFQVKTFGKETKNGNMQGYQIIQYSSGAQPLDQKQMDAMIKSFQIQESDMQKQMHQAFEAWSQPILVPVLQPIILMPEKSDKKN